MKVEAKSLIPSEFGANDLSLRAKGLVPVYDVKAEMLRYLKSKESP